MVAPVHQRCPRCGRFYEGSDCLGQPCDMCEQLPQPAVLNPVVIQAITVLDNMRNVLRLHSLEFPNPPPVLPEIKGVSALTPELVAKLAGQGSVIPVSVRAYEEIIEHIENLEAALKERLSG